jgi:hypothetical protein
LTRRFIGQFAYLFAYLLLSVGAGVSSINTTFAQESVATVASYKSSEDELLTINRVTVLPFTDNLQGIYARPLEAHLIDLVSKMHRWDYIPSGTSGPLLSPEELENSPDKVKQVVQGIDVDAVFSARLLKGPSGVKIHLSLFLTRDGRLFSQAILKDYNQFRVEELKDQLQRLLMETVAKIPYSGRILSRNGNRVTVNLGANDGLQVDQVISVIQIIQVQRHPKFSFIVRTEKEIFGKIKILKVDEALSFGVIVTEKERGAIAKGAKIGVLDFVSYAGATQSLSSDPTTEEGLTLREDGGMVFGKEAKPWKPTKPASFGQVGARFGINRYNGNTNINNVGAMYTSNYIAPSVTLEGEVWITQEFTFSARFRQGIIPVPNPRAGSTPTELGQSLTSYDVAGGYRFRFGLLASSPYIEPFVGIFNYKLFVDNSEPQALMTQQYSGFRFGARGATPIGPDSPYGVGGELGLAFRPRLSESPATTGASSDANVVNFGIFGFRKFGERIRVQAHLDFEMYSATHKGTGTRQDSGTSSSHRYITLSGGLYYAF